MSLSKFERLSKETLEKIAIILSALTFLGPPRDLYSMLLLSREIYHKTSWSYVFSQVFLDKFDISAPVRRLGQDCKRVDVLAGELAIRCESLKRLRTRYYDQNGDVYIDVGATATLSIDMWKAYLAFLESDGKNSRQLVEYAKIDIFSLKYISSEGPLRYTAARNHGWIVDDECNSLAVALFSFTEIDRVPYETKDELMAVLRAFCQPFADPSRYTSTLEPITVATNVLNPLLRNRYWCLLSHISYILHRTCIIPKHFGRELRLAQPRIAEPASVCVSSRIVRLERVRLEMEKGNLYVNGTLTPGSVPAYFEVMGEITKLESVDWDGVHSARGPNGTASSRFDCDWARLFNCYGMQSQVTMRSRVLTPGALHGRWMGHSFDTTFEHTAPFDVWGRSTLAINDRKICPTTVAFELREFHQHNKDEIFPFNDVNYCPKGFEGVFHAWFPFATRVTEYLGKLRVSELPAGVSSEYRTYDPDVAFPRKDLPRDPEAPYGNGVWDIILLGKATRSPAAVGYQYFGRVRSWDGLVVILYADDNLDIRKRRIFFGYLRGYNNIVGRWCSTPPSHGGRSGTWTMTRCR